MNKIIYYAFDDWRRCRFQRKITVEFDWLKLEIDGKKINVCNNSELAENLNQNLANWVSKSKILFALEYQDLLYKLIFYYWFEINIPYEFCFTFVFTFYAQSLLILNLPIFAINKFIGHIADFFSKLVFCLSQKLFGYCLKVHKFKVIKLTCLYVTHSFLQTSSK
jgi:hypothetical protein